LDQRRRTQSWRRGVRTKTRAFGRTDGKTNNTSSRRNGTSFYGPALIGTSIKTQSRVHTCLLNLWPRGRNIKENIPNPFRIPIHTYERLMTHTYF
jgi:hypothetical protein